MKVLIQCPQLLKGFKNRKTTLITLSKLTIPIPVILYFNTNTFMIFPFRIRASVRFIFNEPFAKG